MITAITCTIVYDNTSANPLCREDWGFACVVQAPGCKLLFDTGQHSKILLHNLAALGIASNDFDALVISHDDYDHIGGLATMARLNPRAKIILPYPVIRQFPGHPITHIITSQKLFPGIYSSGTFAQQYKKEQCLLLKTAKGISCLIGCAHPGIAPFVEAAEPHGPLYTLIGGFHGSREFAEAASFSRVCPTHCTQHINEFRNLSAEFLRGGVGTTIEV